MNRLKDVDELGIWLEGFTEIIRLGEMDDKGNVIPVKKEEQRPEDVTASVLIYWKYIEGVFVIEGVDMQRGNIGFV